MELLAEDQVVGAGATPSASAGTGAKTIWEMATVVFKAGSQAPPYRAGGADQRRRPPPADQSAVVTWSAPANGGSPITSYTITPYIGSTAQTPTVITGSPPATTAHRQRPDRRHRLHLHGQRHERRRDRAGVGAVQPGHPGRPHRSRRPERT